MAEANSTTQQAVPQLIIHTQYIKDLSFESPNAPRILMQQTASPEVEVNVNVTANPQNTAGNSDSAEAQERLFEVVLSVTATAKQGEAVMFITELAYAGLISINGTIDNQTLHPLVMIEGPRMLFPFARAIISDATRNGGFMPLNIQPIDFVQIYQSGMHDRAVRENGATERGTAEAAVSEATADSPRVEQVPTDLITDAQPKPESKTGRKKSSGRKAGQGKTSGKTLN